MSARLSAQAGSEKTAGPSEPKVDNPAPVTARLRRLAPLHQRAAIARAMRLAGIYGLDKPALHTLAIAEAPPPLWHRVVEGRGPYGVPINTAEHEHGKKMARRWRTVLDTLDDMLTHAEEMIPDLALAAMPEPDLKRMADAEAKDWRSALQVLLTAGPRPYTPEERRAMCPHAQLRRLRRMAAAARQHAAALFGTVGRGAASYADDYSLQRHKERQANAAAYAAGRVLVTASGKTVPMADIMANSQKAALSRLYSVTKGMDDVAVEQGWAAVFLTVTLPSECHPNPCKGANTYDPRMSPKHADKELKNRLARLRTRMNKANIPSFGTRIAEPHKDGCPHGHLVLYVPQADIPRLKAMLKELWPDPSDGTENEEEKRVATKCETIDRTLAAPTTYLFKYLVKSTNAAPGTGAARADGKEREDGDHLANHDRHRAWASERGIRRWALWGTHGMQRVWQCLHQRREMPADAPQAAQDAWKAIKDRRYGAALRASGAVKHAAVHPRIPAATIAAQAAAAWAVSDTATEFAAALAEHGIRLAHHDKTGRGRLVDRSGKAWALDWLLRTHAKVGGPPAPTKAERMGRMNGYDTPTVAEARARPRLKLAYEEVEIAEGDIRRRPVGITMTGTDWTMPLKERASRVMAHKDWKAEQAQRAEEEAAEERRRAMAAWTEAWARGEKPAHPAVGGWRVTVDVSCPRAGANGGTDSSGPGRTGPPPPPDQAAAPETTTEPELTNARRTRERQNLDLSEAARPRSGTLRTTLDATDIEAMAVRLDDENMMAA